MGKRDRRYDYLRSLSCMAIVLLHVSGSYWDVVDKNGAEFVIMTIYNAMTRFAVPVFMMLSGTFLLDPEKVFSMKDNLRRIGVLLTNFYLWSAFFAFQGIGVQYLKKIFVSPEIEISSEMWRVAGERFLWGHYHMWFVFLIVGFYVLLPLVRKMAESQKMIRYFLVLWIAIRYIIPMLAIGPLVWVRVWLDKLQLNMLLGYLGYFILGYYLRKYVLDKRVRVILYLGGIIGFVYSVISTIVHSRAEDASVEYFFNPSSWNVLLLSAAVFTLFSATKNFPKNAVFGKCMESIAKSSFIIYMLHPFFIEKLNMVGINTISFSCLLSIPVLTILVFGCSWLLAILLKRLPYVNRFLL